MLELLEIIAKFSLFATLAIGLFWVLQIRFGYVGDLDRKSWIIRLLRPDQAIKEPRGEQIATSDALQGAAGNLPVATKRLHVVDYKEPADKRLAYKQKEFAYKKLDRDLIVTFQGEHVVWKKAAAQLQQLVINRAVAPMQSKTDIEDITYPVRGMTADPEAFKTPYVQ